MYYTYMALYKLALKQLFPEMLHLKEVCCSPAKELQQACISTASGASDEPQWITNISLLQVLSKENIQQLKIWFKSMENYLHWFEAILLLATKANIALHLEAGEALNKLFFASIE